MKMQSHIEVISFWNRNCGDLKCNEKDPFPLESKDGQTPSCLTASLPCDITFQHAFVNLLGMNTKLLMWKIKCIYVEFCNTVLLWKAVTWFLLLFYTPFAQDVWGLQRRSHYAWFSISRRKGESWSDTLSSWTELELVTCSSATQWVIQTVLVCSRDVLNSRDYFPICQKTDDPAWPEAWGEFCRTWRLIKPRWGTLVGMKFPFTLQTVTGNHVSPPK